MFSTPTPQQSCKGTSRAAAPGEIGCHNVAGFWLGAHCGPGTRGRVVPLRGKPLTLSLYNMVALCPVSGNFVQVHVFTYDKISKHSEIIALHNFDLGINPTFVPKEIAKPVLQKIVSVFLEMCQCVQHMQMKHGWVVEKCQCVQHMQMKNGLVKSRNACPKNARIAKNAMIIRC